MKLAKSCAVAMAILSPALLMGTTYYASPSEGLDSTNDCLTRETAGNLKTAIDTAVKSADNEVVLLSGTYDCTPYATKTSYVNLRPTPFCFGNQNDTAEAYAINVRSESGNPADTILMGGGEGVQCSLLYFGKSGATNHLTGITIKDFFARGHATADKQNYAGGAISQYRGTTFVSNCVFTSNGFLSPSGSGDTGGGAIFVNAGTFKCFDSLFEGNYAKSTKGPADGGAVFFYHTVYTNELRRCRFIGNFVSGDNAYGNYGGAVWNATDSVRSGIVRAYDCLFKDNYSTKGKNTAGGAIRNVECYGSRFDNNYATKNNGTTGIGSNAAFYDCVFENSTNEMFMLYSVKTVERCTFRKCRRIGTGLTFKNCLADTCYIHGGANNAWSIFDNSTLINCTIVNSGGTCTRSDWQAAPAYDCTIVNCVFSGNTNMTNKGTRGYDISFGTANMTCSNTFYRAIYKNNTDLVNCTIITNAARQLRFKGTGDHPYAIKRNSDLVGAGIASMWSDSDADIIGKPRLRDGECDVGCYQYWDTSFHLRLR